MYKERKEGDSRVYGSPLLITIRCNIAGFSYNAAAARKVNAAESEDGRRGRQSGCRRRVSAKGKAFMRIRAIKKQTD